MSIKSRTGSFKTRNLENQVPLCEMEEPTLTSTDPMSFQTGSTLPEYLLREADVWDKEGKTVWAVDCLSGETQEYGTFEKKTRRIASFLKKSGMKLGDTLIYMSKELINLHVLYTGIWRANGIARAHYPDDTIETLCGVVLESEAKWIVCDEENLKKCQALKKLITAMGKELKIIVMGQKTSNKEDTSFEALLADSGDECPKLELTPESTALVLPTSGTTGRISKGCALSHCAMISMIDKYNTELPWTDSLNFMMVKSMHISGSTYPFSPFCLGKPSLLISQNTVENILIAVEKYKPGCLFGFINYILAVANKSDTMDTTCIENIVTGGVATGASVPTALKQFKNFKKLVVVYGLTEANVLTFHDVKLDGVLTNGNRRASFIKRTSSFFRKKQDTLFTKDTKPLSVGKAAPYTSLQIRDLETGKVLGPNQHGEICAKTSNIFSHYIGRPKETQETFVDGWLRTGDIGYFDSEGFVYVDGRIKEMFKCFGYHISPSEIDEVIIRHPAVATVCTIGVPDPEVGEKKPRAYVTLKDGYSTPAEEIIEFAHGILSDYKKLRGGLYIVPDLPRGSSGKITRALVERKFLEMDRINE